MMTCHSTIDPASLNPSHVTPVAIDPSATLDGTLTAADLTRDAIHRAILDAVPLYGEADPQSLRRSIRVAGKPVPAEAYNRAIRDLKWAGRLVSGEFGLVVVRAW